MLEDTLEPQGPALYLGRTREEISGIFEEAGLKSKQRLKRAKTLGDFLLYHMLASFAGTGRYLPTDTRWLGTDQVSVDSIIEARSFKDLAQQNGAMIGDLTEKLLAYKPRDPQRNIVAVIKRVPATTEEGEFRVLALYPPLSVVKNPVNEEVFGMTRQPVVAFYQPVTGCRKKVCELILGDKEEDILELPYQDQYPNFNRLGLGSKLAFALSGGFHEHEWLHCRISDFNQVRDRFSRTRFGVADA